MDVDSFVKVLSTAISYLKVIGLLALLCLGIGGLHCVLYSRSPRYYFLFAKYFSKWKDTNWKLSVMLKAHRDEDFFASFEDAMVECYGKGCYRRTFNLKNKKLYEFDKFAVTIQSDLDISQTDKVSIEMLFNNVNVTCNNANRMLADLRILFHCLERKINFVEKNYNLNIRFNSITNPFYGLMIQRLGEEHVTHFECVFPLSVLVNKDMRENMKREFDLRVYKDCIVLNESEFDAIELIAQKCLLLGG